MSHEYIEVDRVGGVLVITMDDAATRNAIGDEMASEIREELDRFEADSSSRTLVLTGRDPSFCSGANVKRMDDANRELPSGSAIPADLDPWELLQQKWSEQVDGTGASQDDDEQARFLPLRLHKLRKPCIAAVNGHAMGLGMGIALSCDIRIASENARFSETFIRRGLIPADGSCWQLPRMIGLGNTLLLQYTGDTLDAGEALRLGLVSKVTPHAELMQTTMELAQRLAAGPTYTMALIKRLVQESLYTEFARSLRLATPAQAIARETEDHQEGVRAFVEKRKPLCKGR